MSILRPASAVLAWLMVPAMASAQSAPPVHWFFERTTHDRWITPAERPEFTPFRNASVAIRIDSVRDSDGARTWVLRPAGNLRSWFTMDSTGRVGAAGGLVVPPAEPLAGTGAGREQFARFNQFEELLSRRLMMPAVRAWEFAQPFHPPSLVPGTRWVDTLIAGANDGAFAQSWREIRTSTLLHDTLFDGRTQFVVRDSEWVIYREQWLAEEFVEGVETRVERNVEGVETGTFVFDTTLRLAVAGADTARWSGTSRERFGRDMLVTPISYSRTRTYALVDSVDHSRRQLTRRAALEKSDNAASISARMDSIALAPTRMLASGDTAGAIDAIVRNSVGFSYRYPIDLATAQLAVRVLSDPRHSFALGSSYEYLFGDIAGGFRQYPPAMSDSAHLACIPDACRYIASQWHDAHNEHLRDLGLIAQFALDPVRWVDTLSRRAAHDPDLFQSMVWLRDGVGAIWAAASHAPMPPNGAPWPAWVEWMNGRNAAYPQLVLPGRDTTPTRLAVRFDGSHEQAVRFYQLLSHRDIVGEWRGQLAAATDDSARLVFKTMLIGMHAYQGNATEIATRVLDTTALVRRAAIKEALTLFDGRPSLADSATTQDVQDRFLSMAIERAPFWPPLPGGARTAGPRPFVQVEAPRANDSVFILGNALSVSLRDRWNSRKRVIPDSTFRSMAAKYSSTYYRPSAVWQAGPFVKVTMDYGFDTPGSRRIAPSPGVFVGSMTVYLLKTERGWVLVTEQGFIT